MSIFDVLTGLYAPHVCVGCGVEGAVVCADCLDGLPRPVERCYRCNAASTGNRTCTACRPNGLVAVYAATRYVRTAKEAVHRIKFARAKAASGPMAALMARRSREWLPPDALLVPVPTAASRARMRGYDQAALLARGLSRQSGLRYSPALVRYGRQRQVGAGRTQRREQLVGAFGVRRPARVAGAHIILVDDVVTTGSTLEAAARVLLAAGAASVTAVVFAQA